MAKGKKNPHDAADGEGIQVTDVIDTDVKKGKKKRKDEAQREPDTSSNDVEAKGKGNSRRDTQGKKKVVGSTDEEPDSEESGDGPILTTKCKSGFSVLMQDEEGSSDQSFEEDQIQKVGKKSFSGKSAFQMLAEMNTDGEDEVERDDGNDASHATPENVERQQPLKHNKKEKKKKVTKEKADEDEMNDLDAALADLGIGSNEAKDDDKLNAAQKKKEKKLRQKTKQQQQETVNDTNAEEKNEVVEEDGKRVEGEKKKKKKKNKAAAAEEEKEDDKSKKGKKGPGSKTIQAMQEALKKVQEDEERRRKEEEEKLRKEEEADALRLEQKRMEEERKALKRQKEKDKREQLKKEGKLLTAKQKAEKARAETMLAAMKAQGLDVPICGEKKGPRLGTRVRNKFKAKDQTPEDVESKEPIPEKSMEVESEEHEEKVVPDDSPDHSSKMSEVDKEVLDDWDADSSEDEKDGVRTELQPESENKECKTTEDATTKGEDESVNDDEYSEEDESADESDDEESEEDVDRKEQVLARIAKRRESNEKNRSVDQLRAPVVCVLGHVDTGKTKILDKLRKTHVQDGEAGGITQQIGATNVPREVIEEQCKMVKDFSNVKIPGLLIIDTPGHESFSNLRDRGSSLCDVAVLVIDIMHGLEPQTIESINLLKQKKTPFVIALNKIDRIFEWKSNRHKDIHDVVKSQSERTYLEFKKRAQEAITGMAEQGLNAALFYENPDSKTYISVVPTSAHSGEGMGNLMALLVKFSQTLLAKRLAFSEELQATVLEVKAISGLGTTIDIVLVNGRLKEGQTMILAGTEGPIVTTIKALLTPSKMQDLRVKNTYIEHKEICAAQGVKIAAKDLEKSIAGLNLLVAQHSDEVQVCKEEIQARLSSALSSFKLKERGVFVQASTLGSLEALLEFLRTSKIPFAGVKIGPVVKRDVMKASVMLEHEEKYTVILAFDVKVERDAQELADSMGVRIFQADIIYHLFDRFTEYQEELKRQKREKFKNVAVFPCKLRMLPNCIFNSRDPIVAGVIVEAGVVRTGTPLCVPSKEFLEIGIITSIECNHKEVEFAKKGEEICVKIEPIPGESPKMFGRHFDEKDAVVSKISRVSIDACKDYFRDDLQKGDWQLMVELKKTFKIL